MFKIINLFLCLSFITSNLICQDKIIFQNDNLEFDKPEKEYNWIKSFNLKTQLLEKRNDYRFKYDSAYLYSNNSNIPQSKGMVIVDGNRDIGLSYYYDEESEMFIPNYYNVNTYENELFIKQTSNLWDGTDATFSESNPIIVRYYKYNEDNLLTERIEQTGNDIQNGGKGNRYVYHYDENNLPAGRSSYFWNYDLNAYRHIYELIFRHNEKGLLSVIVNLENRESGWTVEDSTVLIYNEYDHLEIENKYSKGPSRDTFRFGRQYIYHYNNNGSLDQIEERSAPSSSSPGEWNLNYLRVYRYHPYGSLQSEALYNVNEPYDYYYDEQYERDTYEYDENVSIDEVKMPRDIFRGLFDDYGYYRNHMLTEEKHYLGGNQFESQYLDYRKKYFYSEITTSSTDNVSTTDDIQVYPNPSSDYVTIELPNYTGIVDLTLSDINGQVVKSLQYRNGEDISVAELAAGVYVYSVRVDGQVYSGKLCLLR